MRADIPLDLRKAVALEEECTVHWCLGEGVGEGGERECHDEEHRDYRDHGPDRDDRRRLALARGDLLLDAARVVISTHAKDVPQVGSVLTRCVFAPRQPG